VGASHGVRRPWKMHEVSAIGQERARGCAAALLAGEILR